MLAAGLSVLRETALSYAWGLKKHFGIGVSVCTSVYICVSAIGSILPYSRVSLLQPAQGTDQMDDQTLIIPSRPIPSKAVINFAELHQI